MDLFRIALLVFSLFLGIPLAAADSSAAEGVTPTSCGPADSGAPCGGDGPASQGNTSGTNQGAGNPINFITGNKYQQETDLPALPGVLGLEIVRHYNSALAGGKASPGILGRGWRLSYETELFPVANTLQILQADGTRIIFIRDPQNPSACATHDPARGQLAITRTSRGENYQWTWPNGRVLDFDHRGKLTRIKAPTGEFVSLTYDQAGVLVRVTDPQGRSLDFGYPARRSHEHFNGLVSLDTPAGRFQYSFGSPRPKNYTGDPRVLLANLVGVAYPDGTRRQYHYEDPRHPAHLGGISVITGKTATRLSTYRYDAQGRGVLSVRGEPTRLDKDGKRVAGTGIEEIKLDFSAPGVTRLTNSLGQETVYTHAIVGNEHRLLEAIGPGCASCGETNVRYRHDTLGRQSELTRLDTQGRPRHTVRMERDTQGRVVKLTRIEYRADRALPEQIVVCYEYNGNADVPSLIVRPSVVPGKELRIAIEYNDAGQPTRITESGYSPIDSEGKPNPTPITRSTAYRYQRVNGRSLIAEIDGPLSNGPKNDPGDSDITRVEWDRFGRNIIALTRPGNETSTLQYDAAGRIAHVQNGMGFGTTFTYTFRGQATRIASRGSGWEQTGIAPVTDSLRYDALGNLAEVSSDSGDGLRPRVRMAHDIAGRLLWQAEALGFVKQARYDTEGRFVRASVRSASFEQSEHYRYDAHNHVIEVADSTGTTRTLAAARPTRTRPASAFHAVYDDFGREVMVTGASHGVLIKSWDAADRLIEQRDARQNVQRNTWDLAGRRIRHAVIPVTGAPQITTWRYQAGRLVEIVHPGQREQIAYDVRGQAVSRTVRLQLASGAHVTHLTRYIHNDDGSLKAQSLPDGTYLEYERNGQGQVVALHRRTSPWTLFGWGRQTLASGLERDLVGLAHITYGNGIEGRWQRSRQGVLARVVYTQPRHRAADPARLAAATRAAVRQPVAGRLLDLLIPAARAQTAPDAPEKLPGALGMPAEPVALFDARLIYDPAGNVLLQAQRGQGAHTSLAYAYDSRAQLVAAQSILRAATVKTASRAPEASVWRYHYDRNGNRILAQEDVPVSEMGQTRKATYDAVSNALIDPPPQREYRWNAQGQLIAVRERGNDLARYRYDAHGLRIARESFTSASASAATQSAAQRAHAAYTLYNDARQRIADLDAEGRITRQYVWLGDKLIATLDPAKPQAPPAPADGVLAELARTAQALWNRLAGNVERTAFVHLNHLGAPIAATDASGRTLWQADYAPYGKRVGTRAERTRPYDLALRLPGQWADEETGLYYNDFRYYDPQAGRYLSPDPLGRLTERFGSPNAYAYVNNNPASYIDPWGLVLFAFDGTENTDDLEWLAKNDSSLSNVWKFYKAYDDGTKHYITGVGTIHKDEKYGDIHAPLLDAGVAWSGPERIERMIIYFEEEANAFEDHDVMDVDIIGFSRGAAQARDFANRIAARVKNGWYSYKDENGKEKCQKVNLRFMGLWDTVLSVHSGSYNLNIAPGFKHVAHAVALNEYRDHTLPLGRAKPWDTRSWGGFPLESIMGGPIPAGQTRIERGFIGAHADIGGGFGPGENQLAQVALVWMVDQAEAAGVNMMPLPSDIKTIIANPIIHDKSDAIRFGSPNAGSPLVNDGPWNEAYETPASAIPGSGAEDREVRYLDGSKTRQREMTGTGMTFADTEQYITYTERSDLPQSTLGYETNRTGTVDMRGYFEWLNANGYNIKMTVQ